MAEARLDEFQCNIEDAVQHILRYDERDLNEVRNFPPQ